MIKSPPVTAKLPEDFFQPSAENPLRDNVAECLALHKPLDDQGRYRPFDELRHRWRSGLNPATCWAIVKSARVSQGLPILPLGSLDHWCSYFLTPIAHKAISAVDRNASTAALEYMSHKIGEGAHVSYLLNDLIEDEAISSSQLEGAATTTLIAKDMLKRKRQPRTPDERMIIGNYQLMKFAWDNRLQPLSVELIARLHEVGVAGIDDDKYSPGVFRTRDDVVVQDGEGNTVHVPPIAQELAARLKVLADWTNTPHDNADREDYLHPLIKGIALHFALGYEHPFRDGNGRVARALFYWFMFKNDFSAFRYIAISVLLRNAPVKYGRSYLYTETDAMDLTYFIDHQCSVVIRAVNDFLTAYKKMAVDTVSFDHWLAGSALYDRFSEKQKTVFQVAINGTAKEFTAVNVKENLDCSYNTASAVLNGLVDLNVFKKTKTGREWVFSLRDESEIKRAWL
ncbi:MAG: filamentation induced by cAMP protein Fic [Pseudomonas sp.]|uniref:Fic family protein n=1 Tax=Pseudomonas sp. TaxID=306 RepID=UPI002639B427|nr:Fic family protein [Pseudomonas sp.]MDB6050439.1 filamentation induced by cAMP protein Fic [Pseudomonas sp.]